VPSPFPGMDPYLEDPDLWRGLHHRLISAADDQLQPQLIPRGYVVDIQSRIWLEEPARSIYPDVALLKAQAGAQAQESAAGIGTTLADEPVRVQSRAAEVREDYLQIYEKSTKKLITGIELISPTNKSDRRGRALYLRMRRELRREGVNEVEVDLARGGKPLVRLPKSILDKIQPGGYVVNIARANNLDYEFYPIEVKARLPRVGIPLKPGEPDVVLDLQAAVARVYDGGAYSLRIDYSREPVPPLNEENSRWAKELLIEAGLRQPANPVGPSNGPEPPTE
jgi:Protein of unknown function (DUF4058)